MNWSADNVRAAGRLVQWGLRPKDRPAQEPEYAQLVERWFDDAEFRTLVREMTNGLGLVVLEAAAHGIVLGPSEGSAFALRASDFRANPTVEDRLLDGLVQLAIAATVFPRPRDLDDDATSARPPIEPQEVEETLRLLCKRFEDEARSRPDPLIGSEEEGLDEAWRVYQRRLTTHDTRDGRAARRSTLRIIEVNLERLRDLGAFVHHQRGGEISWQPLWRYQVLVKELAATAAYGRVRAALEQTGAHGAATRGNAEVSEPDGAAG